MTELGPATSGGNVDRTRVMEFAYDEFRLAESVLSVKDSSISLLTTHGWELFVSLRACLAF